MDYYIYAYLNPLETFSDEEFLIQFKPFYIGRGKGTRLYDHLIEAKKLNLEQLTIQELKKRRVNVHKINAIKKLLNSNVEPVIVKLIENLSLEESKAEEMRLIQKYGRRFNSTGILTNLTAGGENRVVCNAGPFNPFYGKTHTRKVREKLSKIHKGKIISDEQKSSISKSLKGKPKSSTTKEKMRTQAVRQYQDDPTNDRFTRLGKSREKTWILSSPENEEIVVTNLSAFALERCINVKTLMSSFQSQRRISSGSGKGWLVLRQVT